jgi:TetR/AcrR family transcriptional regulator
MEKLSRRDKEKKAHEAEIIAAAEKLFFRQGFDNVSMDQIAAQAEFSKRTLYQYFSSKEDLYFAVALKAFRQLFAYCREAIEKGKNGFEKIRLSFLAYYRFYKDFPEAFRLMNYLGYVKKGDTPMLKEWMQFDDYMFQAMSSLFEQGRQDGSLRSDLDASKAAYAVAFITTGFFHQLSETGQTFTAHFQLDQEEFCLFALDLLSNALRAQK